MWFFSFRFTDARTARSWNFCFPSWDCSAYVVDHQHILLKQRNFPSGIDFQLVRCKYFCITFFPTFNRYFSVAAIMGWRHSFFFNSVLISVRRKHKEPRGSQCTVENYQMLSLWFFLLFYLSFYFIFSNQNILIDVFFFSDFCVL